MSWGRVLSSSAATVAVAGCVVLAVGMAGSDHSVGSPPPSSATPTHAPIPATKSFAGQSGATPRRPVAPLSSAPVSSAPVSSAPVSPSPVSPAPVSPVPVSPAARATVPALIPTNGVRSATASATAAARPAVRPAATVAPGTTQPPAHRAVVATAAKGSALPLRYPTGSATRVITVTARSTRSTTATVQAWTKAAGGGWKRYGSSISAHIGSDGMSTHASESRSATPMGSFTLTQAFGRNSDPGTALSYFRTTPSDYWISDEGPKYNTHQRCGSCGYHDGVNERLYYVTPEYDYAVVIDYNTRNAPGGVRAGRGSAFFLHVTDGSATAGCVAIPKSRLVTLMRWLSPSAHPRILIGTG